MQKKDATDGRNSTIREKQQIHWPLFQMTFSHIFLHHLSSIYFKISDGFMAWHESHLCNFFSVNYVKVRMSIETSCADTEIIALLLPLPKSRSSFLFEPQNLILYFFPFSFSVSFSLTSTTANYNLACFIMSIKQRRMGNNEQKKNARNSSKRLITWSTHLQICRTVWATLSGVGISHFRRIHSLRQIQCSKHLHFPLHFKRFFLIEHQSTERSAPTGMTLKK